jgi:dTDP-L-rhamnose 4-epimerase
MKILVTGGAGFIGSHIVDELIKDGHYVRIFDNLEPQVHTQVPAYLNKDAEFVRGDVRDAPSLEAAIKDIEVIFHEAAMVGVGQSQYQIVKYVDVNTHGTAKLLELLANREHDVQKLIVASSMSIYGEGAHLCDDCGIIYPSLRSERQLRMQDWVVKCPNCGKDAKMAPTKEIKPLQPTSIYAISKKDQEEMSLAIGRSYGIPTVALRYFNAFGPRQSLSNPYTGVCAIFSARIKNDNAPLIFEDGLQSRDFISVHDIARANILAMESSNADYEVFNVGTGKPTSILDIAQALAKLYHKDIRPEITGKYRAGDIRHCFADISKIKDKLGFQPKVSFKDGIEELVAWGAKEDAIDGFEDAYMELLKRGLVEG